MGLGIEKIINGKFNSDLSSWDDGGWWVWDSNAGDGRAHMPETADYYGLRQNMTFDGSGSHRIAFNITVVSGVLKFRYKSFGDANIDSIYSVTEAVVITTPDVKVINSFFFSRNSSTSEAYLDNVSAKEILPDPTIGVLSLGATTANTQELIWTAGDVNGGSAISGYDIYKDGVFEKSVGVVLSDTVTGLTVNTEYDWTIKAINSDDTAGESAFSNEVTATTSAVSSRKKLVSDFNAGDTVTPMADLLLQVHNGLDDSIIATANYAALGSVNTPGTDGANFVATLNGSQVTLDGVDLGEPLPSSVKIRCKDADGNESELSDAYQIQAALLLFKSKMEPTTEILAQDYDPLFLGMQYMKGGDEGFSWGDGSIISDGSSASVIPSYGDQYSGIFVIGANKPLSIQELIPKIGHEGVSTTVVRQTMEGDVNVDLQQCPYELENIPNIPNKTYQRYWLRYDDLDELLNSGGVANNRMLWQYKSGDWGDGSATLPLGVRTAVTLIGENDGSGKLFWVNNADVGHTGGAPENVLYSFSTENEPDPSMGLNVDGWNLIEIMTTWENDETGALLFRLNGAEVFNTTNVRTLGDTDTEIQFITFWQFYSGVTYGVLAEQWIDDIEIWSDDPAIAFVDVTSVSVAPSIDTINVAATSQLVATVLPSIASNKYVKWTSSDEAVATVDDIGLVTGVGSGTATITGTTDDGDFTDTSVITVASDAYGDELFDTANATVLGAGVTVDGTDALTLLNVAHADYYYYQPSTITIGNIYKVEYEIYDWVEGSNLIDQPYATATESGNGFYSYEDVAVTANIETRAIGLSTYKLRNISIKEVL